MHLKPSLRQLCPLTFAAALAAGAASAQTTVVIKAPQTQVADSKIQGGSYANTVFDGQPLATKVHPTTLTYTRRSVLKFDTHNTVPAGATIQSAKLTLTVKKADAETRTIGLYRLFNTFDPRYATWNTRKSGIRWTRAGGDFGEKFAEARVGATVGAKVTFAVTALVQGVVSAKYGSSRYTRVGLADLGSGSNTSYKEFYSTEAADSGVRPILTVVYGAAASTSSTSASTSSTSSSADTSESVATPTPGQTKVLIRDPVKQVDDARIQGGSYGNTVFHADRLATKVHPSNATYHRRTVLKFDTHNTVPAGAAVQSATLTLTISKADPETRTLGLYRLSQTFDERYATWYRRKSTSTWNKAGGDLAEKWTQASVGASVGSKVTFNVTALVQAVTAGKYGSSRYTRIALVDLGSGSNTSYKEFHPSEASDVSVRPVLTVVYGGTATVSEPAPAPAPAPEPEPEPEPSTSTSGVRLKVLDWNTHYGVGTDGRYDIDRIASYIAKFNPDIISLNEVTRYAYYNSSEDQAPRYAALLKAKTGRRWYYYYRTDNGASRGVGNVVLSRFPIASTSYCQLSRRRVAVNVAVHVNGRLINVWSTHLDSTRYVGTYRIAEVKALQSCVSSFAEQRIVAGDFNARDYTTEINMMESYYYDGWAEAADDGTAIDYPGNTAFGATRNRRIDYVWVSKRATALVIKRAQVFDTRNSRGYMPSDHKPLLVTFEVK